MINMKESNSFDIEGTRKKIRNFLRQEISKRPEMVEKWNAVMSGDVDKYDDYGDLALIEKVFKNYKGKFSGIEYEPDTNTFEFYLPLNMKGTYDWDEGRDISDEMEEEAKKYFGIQNISCNYDNLSNGKRLFHFTLRFGNSYLTPKRKIQQALNILLKDYGTLITSYDGTKEGWSSKDQKIPVKVYIYNSNRYDGPRPVAIWWEIDAPKREEIKRGNAYDEAEFSFHRNDCKAYVKVTEKTTVKEIITEIKESIDYQLNGNKGEEY